jgi:hypothetical protein
METLWEHIQKKKIFNLMHVEKWPMAQDFYR